MCIFNNCPEWNHKYPDGAITRCEVQHCYNSMTLNKYEIDDELKTRYELSNPEGCFEWFIVEEYKAHRETHIIWGRCNFRAYKKCLLAGFLINEREKTSVVIAKSISRKHLIYECPTCWDKYTYQGKPYKNAKRGLHYHGGDKDLGNCVVSGLTTHCRYDRRPMEIHITDATERIIE